MVSYWANASSARNSSFCGNNKHNKCWKLQLLKTSESLHTEGETDSSAFPLASLRLYFTVSPKVEPSPDAAEMHHISRGVLSSCCCTLRCHASADRLNSGSRVLLWTLLGFKARSELLKQTGWYNECAEPKSCCTASVFFKSSQNVPALSGCIHASQRFLATQLLEKCLFSWVHSQNCGWTHSFYQSGYVNVDVLQLLIY